MRELLVYGAKTFKIKIPDDAKVTFGPFSPPSSKKNEQWQAESKKGTLRIYGKTKDDVLAVFSQVDGFRDLSIGYAEEVAREEGAVIWKDDEKGYMRENKVKQEKQWVEERPLIEGRVLKRKR